MYADYWFMIRTLRVTESNETIEINHYFNLFDKRIKAFETVFIGELKYTLVIFDDGSEVIANRDVKRFKSEVVPKYNDLANKYYNDDEE